MRCLKKNKRLLYYANYVSKAEILDTNNHITGEFKNTYSLPVELECNIKEASGKVYSAPFGTAISYQYSFVVDDPNFPISEESIIWYGATPPSTYVADSTDNNCKVKYISRSLNSCHCYFEKI
jgi:hypothetical protein